MALGTGDWCNQVAIAVFFFQDRDTRPFARDSLHKLVFVEGELEMVGEPILRCL